MFAYSKGRSKYDNKPAQMVANSWEEFASDVLGNISESKAKASYICGPMEAGAHNNPEKNPGVHTFRLEKLAKPRRWVPLDVDSMDGAEVFNQLRAELMGYQGFWYTTASSKPESPRCRVILSLDREVSRDESIRIGAALEAKLVACIGQEFIVFDKSVYRPEQPCYGPVNGHQEGYFTGEPLNVNEWLKAAPEAGLDNKPEKAKGKKNLPMSARDIVNVKDALTFMYEKYTAGEIFQNGELYDFWLGCGFGLHFTGQPDAFDIWNWDSARYPEYQGVDDLKARWEGFSQAKDHSKTWKFITRTAAEYGWEPVELEAPFGSELGMSQRFTKKIKGRFRWTAGLDWMRNAGTHWVRDETRQREKIAKEICMITADAVDPKNVNRVTSRGVVSAIIALSQSDNGVATDISEWNKYPYLLNTPGGVYDLNTGRLVEQSDGMLFTQVTRCAPQRIATPAWDGFLSSVFDNNLEMIEFMQRLLGYLLTGSIDEQKLFFFYGIGSNGKSVLLDCLHDLLGDYSHDLPSESLTQRNHGDHPTEYAALHGKRLAISSEIENNSRWAQSKIKALTGNKTFTARFMRQDYFTFNITHKHVIASNHKPLLSGGDYAMARRFVLVPFTQVFEGVRKDVNLPRKLKDEYPGILQWAIDGAVKWTRDRDLLIPESVKNASKEYMEEMDDLAIWISEKCDTGPAFTSLAQELYKSFNNWQQERGDSLWSRREFDAMIGTRFEPGKRTKYGAVRMGIKPKMNFTQTTSDQYTPYRRN